MNIHGFIVLICVSILVSKNSVCARTPGKNAYIMADSVAIAFSSPGRGGVNRSPAYAYQLSQAIAGNSGSAFARGMAQAHGGANGAVAIQHSIAIAGSNGRASAFGAARASSSG